MSDVKTGSTTHLGAVSGDDMSAFYTEVRLQGAFSESLWQDVDEGDARFPPFKIVSDCSTITSPESVTCTLAP